MKLELFYPVKPITINQIFGVNPDTYKTLGLNGHNGIDFYASHGETIRAAHDGVCSVGVDTYGGHGVVVTTLDKRDYKDGQAYFKSIYWHMIAGSEAVKEGQVVKVGDVLGLADSTGFSTGDHLHFGLKPVNDTGDNIEQSNGFLGAINPYPYFNGFYAEDAQQVLSLYQQAINKLKAYIKGRWG